MSTTIVAVMNGNHMMKEIRVMNQTGEPVGRRFHPVFKVIFINTTASCEWARDRAHRRKYEAVFEIQPNTNSMVSII
jgi:hypothetical protein